MKTYIFGNKEIFNKIYEQFFAMRIFHRTDEHGQILMKFATKGIEKELMKMNFIKEQLTEFKEIKKDEK